MWSKYVTRRLAVQVAQAWNFGWGSAMKKVYGVSVMNTLVFRDHKKTEYYVDDRQHKKYIKDLYKLLEDSDFVKNFHLTAQKQLENILKETKYKLSGDLSKLDNAELSILYRDFILPNQTQFYIRMWTVFNIGEPLADVVRKNLEKYFHSEQEVTQYLLDLSSPLVPNDVLNERIAILKLAVLKNKINKKTLDSLVHRHTEKYKHIPMFDFDHEPYSAEYFFEELRSIKNPSVELLDLQKLFKNRRRRFKEILKVFKTDKKFLNLLYFLKENVFLRDYRDMIRQKLNIELYKFYKEIGKRIGLSVEEISTLTNDEIITHLNTGNIFSKKEIHRRHQAFVLVQKGSNVEIFSGKKAIKIAKQELRVADIKNKFEVQGVVGSSGSARGKVKIIFTNKDLYKVQAGDVLVATMTRQDFVPAMRRAAAIVTDEGSVTAHAAIIARELNIPCVLATKIATKIFKDGDMVEVDAKNGIVRKI